MSDDVPQVPAPEPAPDAKRKSGWEETKTDLKWAAALLFSFVLVAPILAQYVGDLPFVNVEFPLGVGYSSWAPAPAGEEDIGAITSAIFDPAGSLVAPFEVLSVLLLAALIAGVVVAFRDPEVD